MPRDTVSAGECPHCHAATVVCRFNRFSREALTIDSWEHQCTNCGQRETEAFRTEKEAQHVPVAKCPYCGRQPRDESVNDP